ncbi:MAG: hypothetical protein ACLR17_18500 [Enterobacteriaceae bacterium]
MRAIWVSMRKSRFWRRIIDAARRFIKQQNARTDGDPAGDQQLLLIAAGKPPAAPVRAAREY